VQYFYSNISANLFVLRTNIGPTHYRTDAMKKGYKLATELFPNNALNNGTTMGNIIECGELCVKYLYCTTFSYNHATHECRFVVGMNAASNATALTVPDKCVLHFVYYFTLFRPPAGSIHMKLYRRIQRLT
jgi:hypothetical protein